MSRKTAAAADPEPDPEPSGRKADRLAELARQEAVRAAVGQAHAVELPSIGGGHGGAGIADIAGVAGS